MSILMHKVLKNFLKVETFFSIHYYLKKKRFSINKLIQMIENYLIQIQYHLIQTLELKKTLRKL
jgi:hypothetical protein